MSLWHSRGMTRGQWHQLSSVWDHATAATGLGKALYVAANQAIYEVEPNGDYQAVGSETWNSKLLVGVDGALISIETGGSMYRLDPVAATYLELAGDWRTAIAATALDGWLFVIDEGGALYRVSPTDGSYLELADGFASTACLAAAGDSLITIEKSGAMYRVSPRDGTWEHLDDAWADARAASGDATTFYVVAAQSMYTVDPTDGTYADLTDTTWNTRLLSFAAGALYAIELGGALYRVDLA